MECLVLVASVRKGLFETDNQRSKFVISIMKGIRDVILTSQGMNNVDNYNEFCRLLFRFRSSAPLNEMAEKPDYGEWIELIADFTLKAVQSWKVSRKKSTLWTRQLSAFWIIVGSKYSNLLIGILVSYYTKHDLLSKVGRSHCRKDGKHQRRGKLQQRG